MEAFRQFPQRDVHLKITGGEPFLDRENFREMLTKLNTLEHFTMRIDSNGSWDPEYFRDLDKKRIFLNIAFHPNEVDFSTFFRRVQKIRDCGFDVEMLNFVLAPENLDAFEKSLEEAERAGFFVNLSPMNPTGAYLSRTERSSREMEIIERYNMPIDVAYKVGSPDTLHRPCFHPALSYYLMFDGRIQVFCVGQFQNIFTDGIPPLPREALPCPYQKCIGCTEMYRALADESMVTTPLSLYPVDEYVREVSVYRKKQRWRSLLKKWLRVNHGNGSIPLPEATHRNGGGNRLMPADAIKPALPSQPVFGTVDGNNGIQARSRDRLALSGWAASQKHGAPVQAVLLLINGREVGTVRHFHPRADIAASFQREELTQCGWRTMVYLPALQPGEYRLTALGIDPEGMSAELGSVPVQIID